MQNFSASPREMAASLWRNKGLIRNLVHREVVGRYRGSMLGIFWSLVTPVFMLAVYTFVFSVVFKARWGNGGEGSKTEFALVLFAERINRPRGPVRTRHLNKYQAGLKLTRAEVFA